MAEKMSLIIILGISMSTNSWTVIKSYEANQ